jgi:hypothetical protein
MQDDIKRKAARHLGELADERAAVETRLSDLHQHESTLEAGQTVAMEWVERQHPSFARDNQNVATVAALLDALPTPSTDLVGKMYPWLKSIPGTTVVQQVESYLQHRLMLLSCPPRPAPRMGNNGLPKGL